MKSKLQWLPAPLRSIGLYALGVGVVNGVNFVTAPLLLALLGTSEFARWGLLEPILILGITLAGFGLQNSLLRTIRGDVDADRRAVEILLPFYLSSAVVVGISSAFIVWWVGEKGTVALLIGIIVLAEATMAFVATLWRCQDRAGLYVIFEGGRAFIVVMVLLLALYLVSFSFGDIADYLWLRALTVVVAMLVAYIIVRPGWRLDPAEGLSALAYGGPIVLASLCAASLTSIDRYALAIWGDSTTIAAYVAHVKLSQVLGSIVVPFYVWFAPKAVYWLEFDRRDPDFIVTATSIYVTVLAGICASIWLATPTIWPIIFPTIELDQLLFAILLVGAAIYALGNPVSIGVLRPGKTYQALVITLLSTTAGAAASFALAPVLSSIGVSLGRGLGLLLYTALFAINTAVSLKINYRWGLCATVILVLLGFCIGIERLVPGHDFISLGLKLASLGIVFSFLLLGVQLRCRPRMAK